MNEDKRPALIPYQSDDGRVKLDVQLDGETIWLTQEQIAKVFSTTKQNVSKHIQNIYADSELNSEQTVNEKLTVVENGHLYPLKFYNLDVIISVGYRINSTIATKFRQWATQTLKEYMVKGFVMDDKRLMQGGNSFSGKGYFDELLERVRKIRMSERLFYEKVKAIFSTTSVDYDPQSDDAHNFYATIQNKFHYAAAGQTAAELIAGRVSSRKPFAGLTHFAGKQPTLSEAKIAKNYMLEDELRKLYLISEQFLSFAELKVQNKSTMTMKDWAKKLDELLKLNDLNILKDKGSISHKQMEKKVAAELTRYKKVRKLEKPKKSPIEPLP